MADPNKVRFRYHIPSQTLEVALYMGQAQERMIASGGVVSQRTRRKPWIAHMPQSDLATSLSFPLHRSGPSARTPFVTNHVEDASAGLCWSLRPHYIL